MSQGKKDKFLPIFFGVLGVGTIVLGYLSWSASSAADDAETAYKTKLADLNRLEGEKLSRTDENADKKKALVETYVKQVQDLGKSLQAYQVEEKPISNSTFQGELKKITDDVLANAKGRNVKLGDKFDLGMGRYLSDFPIEGAAPRLRAQLESIVYLTNSALEAGVTEINSLTRQELEFEKAKKEEPAAAAAAKKKTLPAAKPAPGAKKEAAPLLDEKEVIERQPVTVTVTGKNPAMLRFLESLANASPEKTPPAPHFFVIRTLRVENAAKDGPSKNLQVQVKEEQDPNNKDKPIKYDAEYLLGFEPIKMELDLDIVRFLPEPAPEEKGKPAPKPATAAN